MDMSCVIFLPESQTQLRQDVQYDYRKRFYAMMNNWEVHDSIQSPASSVVTRKTFGYHAIPQAHFVNMPCSPSPVVHSAVLCRVRFHEDRGKGYPEMSGRLRLR